MYLRVLQKCRGTSPTNDDDDDLTRNLIDVSAASSHDQNVDQR